MIYSDAAVNLLESMGLTPVIMTCEEEPNKDMFFIDKSIIWAKLFTYIKTTKPKVNEVIERVPHYNWLKNIIISRNPEIEKFRVKNKEYLTIVLPEMVIRSNRLTRLDSCLRFIFTKVMEVMIEEFSRFE